MEDCASEKHDSYSSMEHADGKPASPNIYIKNNTDQQTLALERGNGLSAQVSRASEHPLSIQPSRNSIERTATERGFELVEFDIDDKDDPYNWSSVGGLSKIFI
jgi:hypothetical protein